MRPVYSTRSIALELRLIQVWKVVESDHPATSCGANHMLRKSSLRVSGWFLPLNIWASYYIPLTSHSARVWLPSFVKGPFCRACCRYWIYNWATVVNAKWVDFLMFVYWGLKELSWSIIFQQTSRGGRMFWAYCQACQISSLSKFRTRSFLGISWPQKPTHDLLRFV